MDGLSEYKPFLLIACDGDDVVGSLMGVLQTNGSGIKSYLSRRVIVWAGPLAAAGREVEITSFLLKELKKFSSGKAIYIEFRNSFDTTPLKPVFLEAGFHYRDHLNYLVKTDEAAEVKKRMSSSRTRQIKSSLKEGAEIGEPLNEQEVMEYYDILQKLYKEKVKKPLSGPDMFLKFWKSNIGKFFVVRKEGKVIGGIVCPVFENKIIYEWYVCGQDGLDKNLHPSVLATWAPIEYGVQHGFSHFDFMGAGRPDQDYGVREFKARFGGQEVCYGRYEMIVNKPLYKVGKIGLMVYQKMK